MDKTKNNDVNIFGNSIKGSGDKEPFNKVDNSIDNKVKEDLLFNDLKASSLVTKVTLKRHNQFEFWKADSRFRKQVTNYNRLRAWATGRPNPPDSEVEGDSAEFKEAINTAAEKAAYLKLNYYSAGNKIYGSPYEIDANVKSDPIYQGQIEIKKHDTLDKYFIKLKDIDKQNVTGTRPYSCFFGNCGSTILERFKDKDAWLEVVEELFDYEQEKGVTTSANPNDVPAFPDLKVLYDNNNQDKMFLFLTDVFRSEGRWQISVFKNTGGRRFDPRIITSIES